MLLRQKEIIIYKQNYYVVVQAGIYNALLERLKYEKDSFRRTGEYIEVDNMKMDDFEVLTKM